MERSRAWRESDRIRSLLAYDDSWTPDKLPGAILLDDEKLDATVAALQTAPLFSGCDEDFLQQLARDSQAARLAPNERLPLDDGSPLLVILHGCLRACVGSIGLGCNILPGGIINTSSMLQLRQLAKDRTPSGSPKAKQRGAAASDPTSPSAGSPSLTLPTEAFKPQIAAYELANDALFHTQSPSPASPSAAARTGADSPSSPISWTRQATPALEITQLATAVGALDKAARTVCLHNICPLSAAARSRASMTAVTRCTDDGCLPFSVSTALLREEDEDDSGVDAKEDAEHTELCAIHLRRIQALKAMYPASVETFEANAQELTKKWQSLRKLCGDLFLGAPIEVMWCLAEASVWVDSLPDHAIVDEGDLDDDAESVWILVNGEAVAEKLTLINEGENKERIVPQIVARLHPGAIIGDPCFVGARITRPAYVRAKIDCRWLRIPVSGLLRVYRRYPGMFSTLEKRMRVVLDNVTSSLPRQIEAFHALQLFSQCDKVLLETLATRSDRRIFYCGTTIQDEGSEDRCLYIVEYGLCINEASIQESVFHPGVNNPDMNMDILKLGWCFNHKLFLGVHTMATKRVRALTPIVVVVALPRNTFDDVLKRFPAEASRFQAPEKLLEPPRCAKRLWAFGGQTAAMRVGKGVTGLAARALAQKTGGFGLKAKQVHKRKPESSSMHSLLWASPIFSACGLNFVEDLSSTAVTRGYMPGQTLINDGAVDSSAHLYMLRGGTCRVELRSANRFFNLPAGTSFGELAMLGVVRRRTATIRALSFCFVLEISRESLVRELERYPSERLHFERLAIQKMNWASGVRWPFLENLPVNLSHNLNLHAERRMCAVSDVGVNKAAREHAVLVLHGQVALLNEQNKEVGMMLPGDCINEQSLMGYSDKHFLLGNLRLKPQTVVEVQVIEKKNWDKFLVAFPNDVAVLQQNLLKEMSLKAERKLGLEPNSSDVLRLSALFRAVSPECTDLLQKKLKVQVYMAGQSMTIEGELGSSMLFILDGAAIGGGRKSFDANDPKEQEAPLAFEPGAVIGEGLLAGVAPRHSNTVKATQICLVHVLEMEDLQEVLSKRPDDRHLFDTPLRAAEQAKTEQLQKRLEALPAMQRLGHQQFVKDICKNAVDAFYAPGEMIVNREKDAPPAPFVLLAGSASIINVLGVVIGSIQAGELLGEPGWLPDEVLGNSDEKRSTLQDFRSMVSKNIVQAPRHGQAMTVKVSEDGLTHAARLCSQAVAAALQRFPAVREPLKQVFVQRRTDIRDFDQKRMHWILEAAEPALQACPIFKDFSPTAISAIARMLKETTYQEGQRVCVAGAEAESMLTVLEGLVEVRSKGGKFLAFLGVGSCFGEEVVMNLFRSRAATLVAAAKTRILAVPTEVVWKQLTDHLMLQADYKLFEKRTSIRREQVQKGAPLTFLGVGVDPTNVSARALALQVAPVHIPKGEIWHMKSDNSPLGAHIAVMFHGSANVEVTRNGRFVTRFAAGTLVLEGLLHDYHASLRALASIEAYRFRECDLLLACEAEGHSASGWFARFEMMRKDLHRKLIMKLKSAKGANAQPTDGASASEHLEDSRLRSWAAWKTSAVEHANRLREERSFQLKSAPFDIPRVGSKRSSANNTRPCSASSVFGLHDQTMARELASDEMNATMPRPQSASSLGDAFSDGSNNATLKPQRASSTGCLSRRGSKATVVRQPAVCYIDVCRATDKEMRRTSGARYLAGAGGARSRPSSAPIGRHSSFSRVREKLCAARSRAQETALLDLTNCLSETGDLPLHVLASSVSPKGVVSVP
eukprot:TRINITY_DN50339_c0_g1_i1.p1 TRINITY_DN50339_c0_g1~~TRINITY_DN50339_c0_g1_i1.p1  ORF type:complete len:1782 (+),score=353.19 TRINITY_DN50339_c0_g1_i1:471-5816(+)